MFSALTLSLSSCNECEGGESGWNPGDQGVTVDQLEKKLAENTKAKIDRINVKSIQNAEKKPN